VPLDVHEQRYQNSSWDLSRHGEESGAECAPQRRSHDGRLTATRVSWQRQGHERETRCAACSSCWFVRALRVLRGASRDWIHGPVTAAKANAGAASPAPAASAAGGTMRLDVAIALGSFVPAASLSGVHSRRVADAIWFALGVVGPVELLGIGPLLGAWHPLRVGVPLFMGTLALYEAYAQCSVWGALSRGYVIALLTFALAGVDAAALFFHELGGAWIVPGFTVLVSLLICAVALVPKRSVPWLQS
jgi:hypothetical protein